MCQSHEQWYCRLFGQEFGPLPFDVLCRMVEKEQVQAGDLVRSAASETWDAVQAIPALRQILGQTTSTHIRDTTPVQCASPPGEDAAEWYYQLNGRSHGPLTFAELMELVGSCGETASDVAVRKGMRAAWVPFVSLLGTRPSCVPAPLLGSARSTQIVTALHDFAGSSIEFRFNTRNNRDVVIAVALWLMFNFMVIILWPRPHASERKYVLAIRRLEAQVKELRASHASSRDWKSLHAHVEQTLGPIVRDLRANASASTPIRQRLLWAARDEFPRLAGPRSTQTDDAERLYELHMQFIERQLEE
jgi:hypothetical protein